MIMADMLCSDYENFIFDGPNLLHSVGTMFGSTCMEQEANVGTEIRVDTVSFDLMHVALLPCRRSSLSIDFAWFCDLRLINVFTWLLKYTGCKPTCTKKGYNGRLFCGHTCTASNTPCRQTSAAWTSKCIAQLWASLLFNGLSFSSSSYLRRWTTSHGTVILCLGYQWMTLEPVWHVERLPHVASSIHNHGHKQQWKIQVSLWHCYELAI